MPNMLVIKDLSPHLSWLPVGPSDVHCCQRQLSCLTKVRLPSFPISYIPFQSADSNAIGDKCKLPGRLTIDFISSIRHILGALPHV